MYTYIYINVSVAPVCTVCTNYDTLTHTAPAQLASFFCHFFPIFDTSHRRNTEKKPREAQRRKRMPRRRDQKLPLSLHNTGNVCHPHGNHICTPPQQRGPEVDNLFLFLLLLLCVCPWPWPLSIRDFAFFLCLSVFTQKTAEEFRERKEKKRKREKTRKHENAIE